jgi:hypothetical protein
MSPSGTYENLLKCLKRCKPADNQLISEICDLIRSDSNTADTIEVEKDSGASTSRDISSDIVKSATNLLSISIESQRQLTKESQKVWESNNELKRANSDLSRQNEQMVKELEEERKERMKMEKKLIMMTEDRNRYVTENDILRSQLEESPKYHLPIDAANSTQEWPMGRSQSEPIQYIPPFSDRYSSHQFDQYIPDESLESFTDQSLDQHSSSEVITFNDKVTFNNPPLEDDNSFEFRTESTLDFSGLVYLGSPYNNNSFLVGDSDTGHINGNSGINTDSNTDGNTTSGHTDSNTGHIDSNTDGNSTGSNTDGNSSYGDGSVYINNTDISISLIQQETTIQNGEMPLYFDENAQLEWTI